MAPRLPLLNIPASYSDLNTKQIKITNHPANSTSVTPIQIVTLYRPGKLNAYTETMTEELEHVFGLFDLDNRVKAIVFTGDGRVFCAGADLDGGFKKIEGESISEHRDGGGRVTVAIHQCRKPTICALQGSAVGVGITMTLPMAIRVAYSKAKIGFVFARRGLVMEAASSYFLPKLVGLSRAMHLITTGATYPANHRLLDGLFSETVDTPEGVLPRALEIAQEYTDNCSGVSWALMRDMMWRNPGSAEGAHLLDSRIIYSLFDTRDNVEGVKSFLEKRKVDFKGSMADSAPSSYPWWEPINVVERAKVGRIGGAKI
ncbi:hypothetical protein EG328_001639 [Venturia inaequalis]|uniref:Enoyl-CoA hydratase n=1 Tax=Venturia inaequalis TaxID=5025 RepID=A0A8H3VQG0_VENIN|nr:hypothetical protein EG328_001639 [Venturia inaequalis]KAE9993494.1 hypothetical protein EG327_004748 [Venturia inaequalis]RDI86258.1 hypothetical protein Vi05172_g3707 [Venturia inaequalis]